MPDKIIATGTTFYVGDDEPRPFTDAEIEIIGAEMEKPIQREDFKLLVVGGDLKGKSFLTRAMIKAVEAAGGQVIHADAATGITGLRPTEVVVGELSTSPFADISIERKMIAPPEEELFTPNNRKARRAARARARSKR